MPHFPFPLCNAAASVHPALVELWSPTALWINYRDKICWRRRDEKMHSQEPCGSRVAAAAAALSALDRALGAATAQQMPQLSLAGQGFLPEGLPELCSLGPSQQGFQGCAASSHPSWTPKALPQFLAASAESIKSSVPSLGRSFHGIWFWLDGYCVCFFDSISDNLMET